MYCCSGCQQETFFLFLTSRAICAMLCMSCYNLLVELYLMRKYLCCAIIFNGLSITCQMLFSYYVESFLQMSFSPVYFFGLKFLTHDGLAYARKYFNLMLKRTKGQVVFFREMTFPSLLDVVVFLFAHFSNIFDEQYRS